MLKIERWQVPAYLSRHVTRVVHVTGTEGPPNDFILPDINAADIAIHLAEVARVRLGSQPPLQERHVVVGSLSRAAEVRHGSRTNTVYISLPPGCACLLNVTAPCVRDLIAPLGVIAPHLDTQVRIWANAYLQGRANASALMDVLALNVRACCDRVVRDVAQQLSDPSADPVTSLASTYGLSRRQLDRRFAESLGRSPREFRRLARFSRAWRIAGEARVESWAAVAAMAGYFDQSHLIREFRSMTNETPRSVFTDDWYAAFEPTCNPTAVKWAVGHSSGQSSIHQLSNA